MDDVESEIVVSAHHSNIHTTPRSILEVRKILLEHLIEACKKPQIASCMQVPPAWRESQCGPIILNSPWTYSAPAPKRTASLSPFVPWPPPKVAY
jgi:hypothetical protein